MTISVTRWEMDRYRLTIAVRDELGVFSEWQVEFRKAKVPASDPTERRDRFVWRRPAHTGAKWEDIPGETSYRRGSEDVINPRSQDVIDELWTLTERTLQEGGCGEPFTLLRSLHPGVDE